MSFNWADSVNSDPVADLRAYAKHVSEQNGYIPDRIFMSQAQKTALERFNVWFEETRKRLDAAPRWRWITRLVLKRQMYGPWHRRNRTIHRLRMRRYRDE